MVLNQDAIVERFGYAVKILVQYEEPIEAERTEPIAILDLNVQEEIVEPEIEEKDNNPAITEQDQDSSGSEDIPDTQPTTRSLIKWGRTKSLDKPVDRKEPGANKRKMKQWDEDIRTFKPLKCELCEETTDLFQELMTHYRQIHDTVGFMECCGQKFQLRYKYHEHIATHMNPDAHRCDICPKSFPTLRALRYHKESHIPEDQRLFQCDICSAKFYRERKLRHHVTHAHATEETKQFKCPDCDKAFVSNSLLIDHTRKMHENLRPFICEVCACTFKTKHILKEHSLTHTVMPRVKCEECGKFYRNENQLRRHKKRHFDQKFHFECPECGIFAKNSYSLHAHRRITHHTDPNKFPCQICGKGFKKRRILDEHMAAHTGDRLYKCAFCEKDFNSSANKYKHQKNKHPTEYAEMKKARELKMFSSDN